MFSRPCHDCHIRPHSGIELRSVCFRRRRSPSYPKLLGGYRLPKSEMKEKRQTPGKIVSAYTQRSTSLRFVFSALVRKGKSTTQQRLYKVLFALKMPRKTFLGQTNTHTYIRTICVYLCGCFPYLLQSIMFGTLTVLLFHFQFELH